MRNEPRDPLDELLRQWARQRAPDEAETSRLRDRIVSALRDPAAITPPAVSPRSRFHRLRSRALWFAAGAAAAVVVMVVLRLGDRAEAPPSDSQDTSDVLAAMVQLPQSELAEKTRLLAGLEELFNGRLAWVAEDGGRVQLGLLGGNDRVPKDARPMVVRVVVLGRNAGQKSWTPVWKADLVTHAEEFVELTPEKADGATLRLWTQQLPDGMIAVDSHLTLSDSLSIQSPSTTIQQSGIPQKVGSLKNGDLEYQVYQTITLLTGRESS